MSDPRHIRDEVRMLAAGPATSCRAGFGFGDREDRGACRDGWEVIGPQLDSRHAPCNLVEIMPRLLET